MKEKNECSAIRHTRVWAQGNVFSTSTTSPRYGGSRGTSILGEVRNVEISRATQQPLNGKSHDFLVVVALAHSKINQIAKFLDDNVRNYLNFLFKP